MRNYKKYIRKTRYLLFTLISSILLAILFQPLLTDKALDVLVNIYSILAGFLIGIIALIGPNSLPKGSWRTAEISVKNIFRKLNSTKILLYIYLITLLFIFLYKLLAVSATIEVIKRLPLGIEILPYLSRLKICAERAILFLSFTAFSYSFKLPNLLFKIQKESIEKEIENRRRKVNIQLYGK